MKKIFIFVSIFLVIICGSCLCFFSYSKFKTYNFIDAFYGVSELSDDNLTYALSNSAILVEYDFKDEYINYLVSLYQAKGWDFVLDDSSSYSFCYNGDCDNYKFYLDDLFNKNYALLVMM